MAKNTSYSLAIDFGTTNLKAATYSNNKASLQKLSKEVNGKTYEPNIITRNKRKDGSYEFEIGSAAEKLINLESTKMKFVYNVKKCLCDENWKVTFHDGYQSNAIELSSEIFNWIYQRITSMKSNNEPEKTVITFPVSFSEMQVNRIRKSALKANVKVDSVISEPIAAFFSFEETQDFIEDSDDGDEKVSFILDFGGGTIDAAIIKIRCIDDSFKISVLSSYGINYGGSNLTDSIIHDIIYQNLTLEEKNDLEKIGYPFIHQVDTEKIRMYSDEEDEAEGYCFIAERDETVDYTFSSDEIESIMKSISIKQKLIDMFDYMLEEANLYKDEDEISVHFIGGGSSIPYFRNILMEYFNTDEIEDFDEDETTGYVALGAAYYAGILSDNSKITFENRSSYQIVGEFNDTGIYLNRQTLYENKTIKKPLTLIRYNDGRKYMKFYQRFTSKSERIYLGYLNLSDEKYNTAEVFDLKILYNGLIEAEIYGHQNESLGKEFIIMEDIQ